MKKLIALLIVAVMSFSLVACSGGSSENGVEPSTKEETTETTENSNESKEEAKEEVKEIDMNNLEQYYDVSKFPGTPRAYTGKVVYHSESKNETHIANAENSANDYFVCEYMKELSMDEEYTCIAVDNNTPDNADDDLLAYVFVN